MKKNLRIVSAAAAALLAVAPVAATAIATPATTAVAHAATSADINVKNDASNSDVVKAAVSAVNGSLLSGTGNEGAAYTKGNFDFSKLVSNFKVNGTAVTPSQVTMFGDKATAQASDLTVNTTSNNNTTTKSGKVNVTVGFQNGDAVLNVIFTSTTTPTSASVTYNGTDKNSVGIASLGNNKYAAQFHVSSVPVSVAYAAAAPSESSSTSVNAGNNTSIFDNTAVNTTIALNAVAKKDGITGALNGSIAVTLNGKSYTALLVNDNNGQNTTVYEKDSKGNWASVKPTDMVANRKYFAEFNDVRVNLGNEYANKEVTINLPAASWFGAHNAAASEQTRTKKVTVDANGVAKLGKITSQFYAYDATDARGINFFDVNTGNVVTSGTVNLHAVNDQLNVESIYQAINAQYRAEQVLDNNLDKNVSLLNDIKSQLEKQNITVDANGYFKAQTPISLTVTAKSNTNGATATLPVTVNVDNVTATAAQETTKNVTIMHISTIYDKNGKATHEPALRAYNSVSVVSDPVSLKDEKGNDAGKFYKLAGKDEYIKVGNVDGTSRTLKHNSYVYKSTGKRANKKTLKSGSSVTTYGKSFMIAGHQMYRIGKNQYVKKANF